MSERILIAGIGNIFLGDDAFGVEVVRALSRSALPAEVKVVDYGIRGFDLTYALLEPWDAVIMVDALSRGAEPGTLFTLELDREDFASLENMKIAMDAHSMDPVRVLALASSLGRIGAQIYVVGCEPADLGDQFVGRMGLMPVVEAAVPAAVEMVQQLVSTVLARTAPAPAVVPQGATSSAYFNLPVR